MCQASAQELPGPDTWTVSLVSVHLSLLPLVYALLPPHKGLNFSFLQWPGLHGVSSPLLEGDSEALLLLQFRSNLVTLLSFWSNLLGPLGQVGVLSQICALGGSVQIWIMPGDSENTYGWTSGWMKMEMGPSISPICTPFASHQMGVCVLAGGFYPPDILPFSSLSRVLTTYSCGACQTRWFLLLCLCWRNFTPAWKGSERKHQHRVCILPHDQVVSDGVSPLLCSSGHAILHSHCGSVWTQDIRVKGCPHNGISSPVLTVVQPLHSARCV